MYSLFIRWKKKRTKKKKEKEKGKTEVTGAKERNGEYVHTGAIIILLSRFFTKGELNYSISK